MMYKRVLLKISGEGLAGTSKEHYDDATVSRIVREVNALVAQGVEVALVVGGGNIWRGRDAAPAMDKSKAHQIGMVATIMNGLYLAEAFRIAAQDTAAHSAQAVAMSSFAVGQFTELFTKKAALAALAQGIVPIFAGGTGHPFCSTDSIVSIRACEIEADAVLYAKSVDGVYDDNPSKNPLARKYKTVSYATALSKQLAVADIGAIAMTAAENIASIVFDMATPDAIVIAAADDDRLFSALGGTKVSHDVADELYA